MDQMYTYPQPAPQQGEPSKRETVEYLHDRNAEQALLGACLLDPEAFEEAPELVQTEDFYPKNHQLIWQTMLELQAEGTRVDLITLSRRLAQRDQLYFVGGGEYLEMLINYLPSSANFRAYARLVADKAIARRLYQASLGIAKIALQEGSGAEKLDRAESLLFSLGRQSEKGQLKHLQPGVVSLIEEAYRQAQAGQPAPGLATGFRDLDQLTSGLHPSQLVILGARPSMGKTAFALGLALNAALQQGKTVAIFSLEMSYEELARRLFCAVAKVNGRALQNGLFGVQLLDRAVEASAGLLEAPIFIDDQGGANLLEIKAKLRRLQKKRGFRLSHYRLLAILARGGPSGVQSPGDLPDLAPT